MFAIYANVIILDNVGKVLNAKYAEKRATDYLLAYCDPSFKVDSPFEDWEVALHEPPPLKIKPNKIEKAFRLSSKGSK